MARRLKTIAAEINRLLGTHGYEATITEGYCNTDRKIAGTRLIHPGKGRRGNRLIVRCQGAVVLDHNSAKTYRYNGEVERWFENECSYYNISPQT